MKDLIWLSKEQENNIFDDGLGASSSSSKNKLEVLNNKIYFYCNVNHNNNLHLNKELKTLESKLLTSQELLETEIPAPIHLHISSYGGSVFAGFSSIDYILKSKVPVITVIDGCAASAATIMSVVAEERYIHEHSFMLIHQLSSGMWGKFEEMKDDMKNSEMLMKKIIGIYEEHTNIPKSKIKDILKRDLWWDAKTCLKYGLVDDIITP